MKSNQMNPRFLLPLLLLAACSKYPHSVEFTHTGCASETKAETAFKSELILEYTADGLAVTRTNALMNCSLKEYGLTCESSISGNTVHYAVYETAGPSADCICRVERMSSTVPGLREDTEYILEYVCDGAFIPINFRYHKGLRMTLDADLYRE